MKKLLANKDNFDVINIIGQKTSINGEINSVGNFRYDGSFDGVINVKENLIIGQQAEIKGKIYAKNIEISGKIDAEIIEIEGLTTIKSTAIVNIKQLKTNKIQIENGAIFNGSCEQKEPSIVVVGTVTKNNKLYEV